MKLWVRLPWRAVSPIRATLRVFFELSLVVPLAIGAGSVDAEFFVTVAELFQSDRILQYKLPGKR
jgi:hypothetical protein